MMSWHGDGHESCHIADAGSVRGLLIHPRTPLEQTFHQCRESVFLSAPSHSKKERSRSRAVIGICFVNVCAVILVLQPGSPSKRTDEKGYLTSCQDGIKHKGLSIKTVALQWGEGCWDKTL